MKLFAVVLLVSAVSAENGFNGYSSGRPSSIGFSSGSGFSSGGNNGYSSGASFNSGFGGGSGPGASAATVRFNNENNGDGTYKYDYETSNQIKAEEAGQLQQDSLVVRGSYSWVAPDGQMYTVNYVADENGYHPSGAHIQGQEAIERSIQFNARNPQQDQSSSSFSSGGFSSGVNVNRQYLPPSNQQPTRQYLPPSNNRY